MASDIWLRTILIVRNETRCRHIGYSYRLAARVLLYAPSHRQDNTYHGLCYTSRGALAGTRNSSIGPPHEGSIRRPIAPWANALTTELRPAPSIHVRPDNYIKPSARKLIQLLSINNTKHYTQWRNKRGLGDLYRGGNFAHKCICTAPIGAQIYIWPRAAKLCSRHWINCTSFFQRYLSQNM